MANSDSGQPQDYTDPLYEKGLARAESAYSNDRDKWLEAILEECDNFIRGSSSKQTCRLGRFWLRFLESELRAYVELLGRLKCPPSRVVSELRQHAKTTVDETHRKVQRVLRGLSGLFDIASEVFDYFRSLVEEDAGEIVADLEREIGFIASEKPAEPGQEGAAAQRGARPSDTRDPRNRKPVGAVLSRPGRTPDLQTSRKRIRLVNALAHELALVKVELKGYCTVAKLKAKFPKFALWGFITDSQIQELIDSETLAPKAYAENLVLRNFGLTSRETLRYDRKKLRQAKARLLKPTGSHL